MKNGTGPCLVRLPNGPYPLFLSLSSASFPSANREAIIDLPCVGRIKDLQSIAWKTTMRTRDFTENSLQKFLILFRASKEKDSAKKLFAVEWSSQLVLQCNTLCSIMTDAKESRSDFMRDERQRVFSRCPSRG